MDYDGLCQSFLWDFQAKNYHDIPSLLSFLAVPLEVVCNRGRTNGGKPETWRHFLEGNFYRRTSSKKLDIAKA